MKKKLILLFGLSICNSAFAATVCEGSKTPSGYSAKQLNGTSYTTYAGYASVGQSNNKLFIHPDDCDSDEDNNFSYRIEALPCSATDKGYNEIMAEAFKFNPESMSITGQDAFNNGRTVLNYAADSTTMKGFSQIQVDMIVGIQNNSQARHCDSPAEYDGGYNKEQFCGAAGRIFISQDAIVQGIPASAETECWVELDRDLKVGQQVVLSNTTNVSGINTDLYTMGYATVSCGMNVAGDPTLIVDPNPNDGSCNLNDINFYSNPLSAATCKQVCFWAEDMYCPPGPLEWTNGINQEIKCRAQSRGGYLYEEIELETESENRSGMGSFSCTLGGKWVADSDSKCKA
jgi:hypothetical protein